MKAAAAAGRRGRPRGDVATARLARAMVSAGPRRPGPARRGTFRSARARDASHRRPRRPAPRPVGIHHRLDLVEASLHIPEVVVGHQRADEADREDGTVADDVDREVVEPPADHGLPPVAQEAGARARRAGRRRRRRRRPARRTASGVSRGSWVALANQRHARRCSSGTSRVVPEQVHAQDVGEQVVVAVPPAVVVEGTRNRFCRSSRSSMTLPLPAGPAWTASHSGAVSRSSTAVSSRKRRTSSGCRSSTSSTGRSTTNRSSRRTGR